MMLLIAERKVEELKSFTQEWISTLYRSNTDTGTLNAKEVVKRLEYVMDTLKQVQQAFDSRGEESSEEFPHKKSEDMRHSHHIIKKFSDVKFESECKSSFVGKEKRPNFPSMLSNSFRSSTMTYPIGGEPFLPGVEESSEFTDFKTSSKDGDDGAIWEPKHHDGEYNGHDDLLH